MIYIVTYVKVSNTSPYVTSVDPSHSYSGTADQIFGFGLQKDPAPMDGFVYNYLQDGDTDAKGADIMKCFDPDNVPAISTLAREFAVFDRWYCSVPGPTQPNRLFFHSCTSRGDTFNNDDQLALGYPQKTIYDSLYEAGLSWRTYFSDFPSVLFLRKMRSIEYLGMILDMGEFYSAAASGELPAFTFLEPRWFDFFDYPASDEHPPHDVKYGEYLIADVYEALRNGPKWNNTLLIITYDEHGGFYDHVPPPQHNVPAPDSHTDQFGFDRLGVRVPTIMVSPWINAGTVVHEPAKNHFDHTSVAATLKKLYDLPAFLTKRDAWAATFEDIVNNRSTPRTDCPTKLPRPGTADEQAKYKSHSGPITPGGISEGVRDGSMSKAPVSDLQWDLISIAQGLDGDTLTGCLSAAEEQIIQNEHHGAIFVQKQLLAFLERQKQQKKIQEQKLQTQ
jgi:phospholipase C